MHSVGSLSLGKGLDSKMGAYSKLGVAVDDKSEDAGISPLRRQRTPPPVEMTVLFVVVEEENRQRQEQRKGWPGEGVHPTLRGETAKDGAPELLGWVEEENRQRQE